MEVTVDFGESNKIVSVFLSNGCHADNWLRRIHISQFLLGDDSTEFSASNVVVKDNVVSGGFFELDTVMSGRYLSIRRDQPYTD